MQREILSAAVPAGLSAEETAEAVGSTPGTVRVALHEVLARLHVPNPEDVSALPDAAKFQVGDVAPRAS